MHGIHEGVDALMSGMAARCSHRSATTLSKMVIRPPPSTSDNDLDIDYLPNH